MLDYEPALYESACNTEIVRKEERIDQTTQALDLLLRQSVLDAQYVQNLTKMTVRKSRASLCWKNCTE